MSLKNTHQDSSITKTRSLIFCLIVDDFGIKYIHKYDAQHLINHLRKSYKATVDSESKLFCELHLNQEYYSLMRSVELEIPLYVKRVLTRFLHTMMEYSQHLPHPFTPPTYDVKEQHDDPISNIPLYPLIKSRLNKCQACSYTTHR